MRMTEDEKRMVQEARSAIKATGEDTPTIVIAYGPGDSIVQNIQCKKTNEIHLLAGIEALLDTLEREYGQKRTTLLLKMASFGSAITKSQKL